MLVYVLLKRAGVIELHLDDSIDSKSLLGTYVCTDVPGEFTWSPGPLTQVGGSAVLFACMHLCKRVYVCLCKSVCFLCVCI